MRPIAMPETWFPHATRAIIGGEKGSEPAEYIVEVVDVGGADTVRVMTLVQLDPDEVAQITETGYLFLTMWGGELPWNISPAPVPE